MSNDFRRDLSLRYDFSTQAAFSSMDFRAPLGRITWYEIADFVWDFYVSLSETELDAIIRRCDTDEDEAMNFNEFAEVVGNAAVVVWPLTATIPAPLPLYRSHYYDPYLRRYVYDYEPIYYPYYRETLRGSPVRTLSSYTYSPVRRTYSPIRSIRESPVRTIWEASPLRTYISPARACQTYSSPVRTATWSSPLRQKSPGRTTKSKKSGTFKTTTPAWRQEEVKYESPFRHTLWPYEEEEFVEAMKELISLEHELEIAKQNLALRADFNLYDAFKIFDPTNYGSVALIDIQDAFNSYGVYISREESDLILQRYDNNRDARLTFSEFSSMFTP